MSKTNLPNHRDLKIFILITLNIKKNQGVCVFGGMLCVWYKVKSPGQVKSDELSDSFTNIPVTPKSCRSLSDPRLPTPTVRLKNQDAAIRGSLSVWTVSAYDVCSDNAIHSDVIGSAVAQSVELETRGEEVLGSIPAVAALCLLVGVSIMWPAETEVMVSPLCLMCGSTARKIVRHQSLDPSVINLVFTRTLRNQTKTKQNKIRFISIVQIFFPPEI